MTPLNPLDFGALKSGWEHNAQPFPHLVIDDFLAPPVAQTQYQAIRDHLEQRKTDFVKYEQRWEKLKFTDNKLENMPAPTAELLKYLNSGPFTEQLERITGLKNLKGDDGYWGGGIHATYHSGKLNVHHDFTILPTTYGQETEWQRVLNLIVYLNPNWKPEWAGQLELWDSDMTKCELKVNPQFNRAVLFHTFESNHGQPDPYVGPLGEPRISIATYYYQPIKPGSIERRSTYYRVRPGENETDAERDERMARSSAARYKQFGVETDK